MFHCNDEEKISISYTTRYPTDIKKKEKNTESKKKFACKLQRSFPRSFFGPTNTVKAMILILCFSRDRYVAISFSRHSRTQKLRANKKETGVLLAGQKPHVDFRERFRFLRFFLILIVPPPLLAIKIHASRVQESITFSIEAPVSAAHTRVNVIFQRGYSTRHMYPRDFYRYSFHQVDLLRSKYPFG